MRMIIVEGNIAAGKTELCQVLEASGQFTYIPEPVEAWRESGLLQMFYDDPARWAFTFQVTAFGTRAKTQDEIFAHTDCSHVVLERSIYTDRYVFAKNCYQTELMTWVEYDAYCRLWDFLAVNWCVEPDRIIYLRTPATVCLRRIRQRGRFEERNITLEYLQQLALLHDDWLLDRKDVLVLDGRYRWTAAEVVEKM